MKKRLKFLSLILSAISLFSVFATACKDDEKEIVTPEENNEYVYEGTHIYDAPDTDDWLVRGGETDYALVIPQNASERIQMARDEFVDLFRDATGITLRTLYDTDMTHNASSKYISLGETTLLESSGIEIDHATLTQDGHRIVTKDKTVYLCGGMDEGTLFAVYTFMSITFNYETYYIDCMEIDRTNEKKLKAYNVTDIPDFKHRASNDDIATNESVDYDENMFGWRMRYKGSRGYHIMPVHKVVGDPTSKAKGSTNVMVWYPQEFYYNYEEYPEDYHPKWFADNKTSLQACFTAHGDEAEYQAMLDLALEKVKFSLQTYPPDKYPQYNAMTLTHEDNLDYCPCKSCQEIAKRYDDCQSAVQILFMNDLGEMVDEMLEENKNEPWYREDFTLLFFAYQYNMMAPARYDTSSKKYVPIDEEVVLHDRVGVYCAFTNLDAQMRFDDPSNAAGKANAEAWTSLTDYMYFWTYANNFRNYLYYFDSFEFYTPEAYSWFACHSDRMWFQQRGEPTTQSTGWQNLKVYLDAKLSWDTSLDYDTLIRNWFNAMFKDAAPRMLSLFQQQRAYCRSELIEKRNLHAVGDGRPDLSLLEYWPLPMVESWIDTFDAAKVDVERYKYTDPELYEKTCQHIEIEALDWLYILVDIHNVTIAEEKRLEYVNRLQYDAEWLDLEGMSFKANDGDLYAYIMALK